MQLQTISFKGLILERGFWLYVWHITEGERRVIYIGRTGDSSSPYASSPFNRMGQHLDMRNGAPANMLKRNLEKENLNPVACEFELIAVGPIFPEQASFEEHKPYRDIIAPLETALAVYLNEKGYEVIGKHGKKKEYDKDLFEKIIGLVTKKLPDARLQGHDERCQNSASSAPLR